MARSKSKTDLYKSAGVDIAAGDAAVDWLLASPQKKTSASPYGRVLSGIGGFAGLFAPNFRGIKKPLLVASTDGVGTKLLLGLQTGLIDGLGQDLVAMCANDLYTIGARPLFFLDYFATGKLDPKQFKRVLTAIKNSCDTCGMSLLGGETAELPGLYEGKHFDLAGFIVGVVDEKRRLGPHLVKPGDLIFALGSSGFHSNGYSLVRKWAGPGKLPSKLARQLMAPTRLYPEIPELWDELGEGGLHAVANITGGGISGNLPRVMPKNTEAHIVPGLLPTPPWMKEFIEAHTSELSDVEHVFNLGAGMIAIVPRKGASRFEKAASHKGLEVTPIGEIRKRRGEARVTYPGWSL